VIELSGKVMGIFWEFSGYLTPLNICPEEFEDTKGVVRIRISKKNTTMAKRKSTKRQTTIYKTYT
jgi:hypothetical protein